MNLTVSNKDRIIKSYGLAEDETDRKDTIIALAEIYETSQMVIRQILRDAKVFIKKEGKTKKEQYANALWSITNIPAKEWMKLTFNSQEKMMNIFRESNHNG